MMMYKRIAYSEEVYREQLETSVIDFNIQALKALTKNKGKDIVFIEKHTDLLEYNKENAKSEDVIIISKTAQDFFDMQFMCIVLSGNIPVSIRGFIPCMSVEEIIRISKKLEEEC